MYKQRISFFVFVFALLLINQVRFARSFRRTPPFGKRGSTYRRFVKVCNNCCLSTKQIFIFLACNIVSFMFFVLFDSILYQILRTTLCPDILSNVFNIATSTKGRAKL